MKIILFFKFAKLVTKSFHSFSKKGRGKVYLISRPLFCLSRSDIKKLCFLWQLPIYPDKTNEKLKFSRNRIRKQLIPTIRFYFNCHIDTLLFQFITIVSGQEVFINYVSYRLFSTNFLVRKKYIGLNTALLKTVPLAIKQKIIKDYLESFFTVSLQFSYIENFLQFLNKQKRYKNELLKSKKKNNYFFAFFPIFQSLYKNTNFYKNYYQREYINFNDISLNFLVNKISSESIFHKKKKKNLIFLKNFIKIKVIWIITSSKQKKKASLAEIIFLLKTTKLFQPSNQIKNDYSSNKTNRFKIYNTVPRYFFLPKVGTIVFFMSNNP